MGSPNARSCSDEKRFSGTQRTAIMAAAILLGSSVLVRTVGVSPGVAIGVLAFLAGGGFLLVRRRRSRSAGAADGDSDADSSESDESNVWNAIPSRQYSGRHVESGGLSRGEQEQALQDIQRQADELADDPSRK
ncbi:hypothetical protein GS429_12875 [Natronorubrum sp. JWXQ-INN-674]|uniref:Uncharacterized protein n=1 Tax=Natronorubrum halalkaliphilum TaxID=2691917 RepID=A0A6B0VNX8_9EURY|nr:hypothetical protein [Natronorubrum halalkaliphilum]MXV62945.1 hypothetical protein [Natronorubrum halalkaliphilum]